MEPTNGRALPHWAQSNWTAVEAHVRHLQGRISRAAAQAAQAQGHNLPKRLARARSATLQAIRQVPQEHSGPPTPGIAGVGGDPPQKRLALWQEGLSLQGYRPPPVTRCYLPTRSGGQRP
jgi:hypothetical protein